MKHTQGDWNVGTAAGGSVCVRENGRCNAEIAIICTAEGRTVKEVKANAKLIAIAGTVHNETGYTPRELLEQRDKLLAACKDARGIIDAGYAMKCIKAPRNYHVQLDLMLKQLTAAIALTE